MIPHGNDINILRGTYFVVEWIAFASRLSKVIYKWLTEMMNTEEKKWNFYSVQWGRSKSLHF